MNFGLTTSYTESIEYIFILKKKKEKTGGKSYPARSPTTNYIFKNFSKKNSDPHHTEKER